MFPLKLRPKLGSFIKYIRKIFRKTNISNPLIRTHTCAYQGIRNVSFLENFAYVLNGWPPCEIVDVFRRQANIKESVSKSLLKEITFCVCSYVLLRYDYDLFFI